jgi:regulatory protein
MAATEPVRPRPRGSAKDRALGLLAVRWRSRAEIERRLRLAGYQAEEIEPAIADLERAGLIEDVRFAREMVRDQSVRKLSGERAMRTALRQKGVAPEVVEAALEGAGDEGERALRLASKGAARMGALAPEAAYRRLFALLMRRGYAPTVAREACRQALKEALWAGQDLDQPFEP